MKVWHRLVPKSFEPVRAVEWVITFYTFVGAAYLFTPLYETSKAVNGASAFATALMHPALIFVFGGLLVLGAVLMALGLALRKYELLSSGLFTIAMVRFFQVLTTILAVGLTPISWIYPLTISTICIILWIWTRIGIINGRS